MKRRHLKCKWVTTASRTDSTDESWALLCSTTEKFLIDRKLDEIDAEIDAHSAAELAWEEWFRGYEFPAEFSSEQCARVRDEMKAAFLAARATAPTAAKGPKE